MWWSILKVQESITDLGLDFESPDEKLEPKDKDRDCCEQARFNYKVNFVVPSRVVGMSDEEIANFYDSNSGNLGLQIYTGLAEDFTCEQFRNYLLDMIDRHAQLPFTSASPHFWNTGLLEVLKAWEECENE